MRTTTFLFVALVTAIAIQMSTGAFAQDTSGPRPRPVPVTLYTSPVSANDISCNVLNTSTQALPVEIRLVYTSGPTVDDTSVVSTPTVASRNTASLGGTALPSFGVLYYCRFAFTGNKSQVRATMVAKSGDNAVSSEAR